MAEYVEREELMRRIKEIHCAECDSYHGVRCRACWVDDTLNYVDSEPAADVEPVRHGKWNDWEAFWKECSCCRYRTQRINVREYFFCPNCGCRMDEKVDT